MNYILSQRSLSWEEFSIWTALSRLMTDAAISVGQVVNIKM